MSQHTTGSTFKLKPVIINTNASPSPHALIPNATIILKNCSSYEK